MTAVWLPAAAQVETWAAIQRPPRVFDPDVFDNNPIFDTGTKAGTWDEKSKQPEVWTGS